MCSQAEVCNAFMHIRQVVVVVVAAAAAAVVVVVYLEVLDMSDVDDDYEDISTDCPPRPAPPLDALLQAGFHLIVTFFGPPFPADKK